MTETATHRALLKNRLLMQIDEIASACGDMEIIATWNPIGWDEDEAYARFLDAIYDLTEIEAIHERAEEVRDRIFMNSDRTEEIAECRKNHAHVRADKMENGQ